jgi:hypothetical protein
MPVTTGRDYDVRQGAAVIGERGFSPSSSAHESVDDQVEAYRHGIADVLAGNNRSVVDHVGRELHRSGGRLMTSRQPDYEAIYYSERVHRKLTSHQVQIVNDISGKEKRKDMTNLKQISSATVDQQLSVVRSTRNLTVVLELTPDQAQTFISSWITVPAGGSLTADEQREALDRQATLREFTEGLAAARLSGAKFTVALDASLTFDEPLLSGATPVIRAEEPALRHPRKPRKPRK